MIESKVNVILADWETYQKELRKIREVVVIKEQSVPKEEEWDGHDEESWHFLALSVTKRPIGCARLMQSGQIGRMAVLKEYRKKGVATELMDLLISYFETSKYEKIILEVRESNTSAQSLYKKYNFKYFGKRKKYYVTEDADIFIKEKVYAE